MKKLVIIALAACMLTLGTIEVSAQRAKTSKSSSTILSPEAFVRKWQDRLAQFSQGIIVEGCPKQFFTQMEETFPDNFHMEFVTTQNGVQYYGFAYIPDNHSNILSGSIGFKNGKLYGFEANSWGYDIGYVMQLKEQLNWNSTSKAVEQNETVDWGKPNDAERRAEEKAKADQWNAVLAAKKAGDYSYFLLEADKYSKLSIDDEARYRLNLEIIDFYKGKQEYEKAMDCCEDVYSAKGFKEKNDVYITDAKRLWNELATLAIEQKRNSPEYLCSISKNSCISEANKTLALQYAQEYAYNNVVLEMKDFVEVADAVYMRYSDVAVFDNNYKSKIKEYSESLRKDSVSHLLARAKEELTLEKYALSKSTCDMIERIDKTNEEISNLRDDADYGLLMQKTGRKVGDYTSFLQLYPRSKYYEEVSNLCAMEFFTNKDVYKKTNTACAYSSFLNDMQSRLVLSSEKANRLSKEVHSADKKCRRHRFWDNTFDSLFRCYDCRFASINLGGSLGITGGTEFVGSGEVGLRLFHKCKWLNVYLGAKYLYTSGATDLWAATELLGDYMDGYLESKHIAIPAELRINFQHECEESFYLGLGVEYGIPLSGSFTYLSPYDYYDKKKQKSKDFLNPAKIWPRASIGYSMDFLDFSLTATYMPDGLYNIDKLRMASADELVGPSQFDKQMNSRFRVELSLKYFY